ncbi:MAG: TonB-dependent receptor plug domain-containing protein [Pseudomonadota bacterium]
MHVSDALRALSGTDLQFVFSSRLVPETLRVLDEPGVAGSDRLAIAIRILKPHGLTLTQMQVGLYAVVERVDTTTVAPPTAAMSAGSIASAEPVREVVVSASHYRIGDDANLRISLTHADLTDQPGIGDDPFRALARVPGVVQDGVSAQPNVRGGETGEVLMLLDGYPLRSVFHLPGYQSPFSVLDSGLISTAEVYTGGYPARFGNRMAGVFDFHSLRTTDEPHHSLGVDFFNASARSTGRWESADVGYVASARVGTLSPILAALSSSVGDPRYEDAYLRLETGDAESLRVTANLLWAHDELSIEDGDSGEQAQIDDQLRYLWLRADRNLTTNLIATAWFGQSLIQSVRDGNVRSPGIATGDVSDRRTSTIWDLRGLLQWQLGEREALDAGIELTQEDAVYRYGASAQFSAEIQRLFAIAPDTVRTADFSPRRRRSSFFVSYRSHFGQSVTTELGVRAQGIVSSGLEADWFTEPRFSVNWAIAERTHLSVSWGVFHQADEVHELKVEDGLGNFPPPQRSDHLIAGIQHAFSDELSVRAEVFRKRQNDPRAHYENLLNRRTILPEIAPDRVRVSPEYGELDGAEVSGGYRLAHWNFWASASIAAAFDETANVQTPRSWDQSWSVASGLRWERGPWLTSATLTAHSGLPIAELIDSGSGLKVSGRNSSRLPTFLQLDFRVRFEQRLALGSLQYSLEILNATNQTNDCCTEILIGNQGPFGRPLRGLPFFPSLGVRWNW